MRNIPPVIGPDAFIHQCLASITQLIPGAKMAFYLVDANLTPECYILRGISAETHQLYLQTFQPLDPLHPRRFNQQSFSIVGLDGASRNSAYYRQFMLPHGILDMAEIFVRQQKRIVAGLCIMRESPFTLTERLRLRAALPLIELAITELLPCEPRCQLTPKERQVAALIREGACNKRIALRLEISLSTVKTHLRNIFAKTQTRSRTELVATLDIADYRDAFS